MLLFGLYTPDPAMFPSMRPSGLMDGEMNDPSVYTHCCGWNCLYFSGRGVPGGQTVNGFRNQEEERNCGPKGHRE